MVLPPATPPSLLLTAPPRSPTNPYPNHPAAARACVSVFVNICEVSWFVGVQLSVCVCMHVHSRASDHANSVSCANVCVYACMYQRLWMCVCAQFLCVLMCVCVYVGNRV